MSTRAWCTPRVIATSGQCEVAACMDCGQVILTLPHLTLRLPLPLFGDAAACMEMAAAALPLQGADSEDFPTAGPQGSRRGH